jgi:hypothetical protein
MRRNRLKAALATGIALACPGAAAAASEPVAIVEDVAGVSTPLQMMDYLSEGRVIELGAAGVITLAYFSSCVQETVSGGRVVVGREQSAVEGGEIERKRAQCADEGVQLSSSQAKNSGAVVFRDGAAGTDGFGPATRRPEVVVYGTRPVFVTESGRDTLAIERLDRPDRPRLRFALDRGRLDMARTEAALEPGGIYMARAGGGQVVFKVDPLADTDGVGLLARLVRF